MTKEEKNAYMKAWRVANPEKVAASKKRWQEANPEKLAASRKRYQEANREKLAASRKRYQEANPEKVGASQKRYQEANPEKVVASKKRYREANPEKAAASQKRYREANRGKVAASQKRYYGANIEQARARQRACYKRNPRKHLAKVHKRRAAKLNATPRWATDVDQHVEQLALQRTPDQHIDHVIPLSGRKHSTHCIQLVCGLHTAGNLKLISAAENLSKGCREWPDMWSYTPPHMSELALLWQPYSPARSALRMKPYV